MAHSSRPRTWLRRLLTGDHDDTLASERAIAAEEPKPMTEAEIAAALEIE